MTECGQERFEFEAHYSRQVTASFDGGTLTSNGGALLLRQADKRIGLLKRLAGCFTDCRRADRVEHPVGEMLAQRIYGLALGYEDVNDHEQLRRDPLMAVLAGKRKIGELLCGKSTLNRMEWTPEGDPLKDRYSRISYSAEAIDELLVTVFLESRARAPRRIVLDLDSTDVALPGRQEQRFFHGYYNHYCYLPLYIFCGDHLLRARLRPANIDGSAGALEEVAAVAAQIRARWPKTQIILRADSGLCRDELMSWCEANGVDYVFGFARNERLRALIEPQMQQARTEHERTSKAARVFTEFDYQTRESWSRARRIVAKAEQIAGKENPRYVVTSLAAVAWPARLL